jgi:acetyl-CoA carboxylase biotin carboxyl carrier protein
MPRQQENQILAEMVANVLTVDVATGDTVAVGDTVVLLESMKMEIPVISEHAGTVSGIYVTSGDVVQEGDVLLAITP